MPAHYFSIGSPFVSLLVSRSPLVYYWVGFYCFLLGPLRFHIVPPRVLMGSPSFLDWDLLHFLLGSHFCFLVGSALFSVGFSLLSVGSPFCFSSGPCICLLDSPSFLYLAPVVFLLGPPSLFSMGALVPSAPSSVYYKTKGQQ